MRRRIRESWHRFYDPATGRYISADPIGLEGGMNLYAYTGGDPVNYIDPLGLWFGADDVFTGPVDEIIVLGGLTVLAMAGNDWAAATLDSMQDLFDDLFNRNNDCNDPCKELEKEIRRLRKSVKSHIGRIREHLDKFNQYSKNPLSMDNDGILGDAINKGLHSRAWNIYNNRRQNLMGTVKKHMAEGEKAANELQNKINEWNRLCGSK